MLSGEIALKISIIIIMDNAKELCTQIVNYNKLIVGVSLNVYLITWSILVMWFECRFRDTEVDGSNPGICM